MVVPYSKWTQTGIQYEKRQQKKVDEFSSQYKGAFDRVTSSNSKESNALSSIFNRITKRVQKEHPGMSRVKATLYARHKDPVGRKYNRLVNAGYGAKDISKALFGSGRHGASRSGRGGG